MASGLDPDFYGHDSNPYAPPRSEFEQRPRGLAPAEVPFDVGCIVSATWALYKARLGACFTVCWTVLALMWGIQFGQVRLLQALGLAPGDWFGHFLIRFAIFFAGYVFNVWMGIGENLAMLAIARREPAVLERLFQGGRFVLTSIVAAVLFMLVIGLIVMVNLVWLPILTGVFGQGSPVTIGVFAIGIAIAVIVGSYISARFSQFPYMIIDQNTGALDAMQMSWEATRGRVGTLMLVYSMLLLINLGGLLTCLVGLLFTIPFTGLMVAVTYLSMTGQPVGGGKPGPAHWDEMVFPED